MTSILSGLDTVRLALAAQQFALSATQRNVANANDPSYTRQQVIFTPIGDISESGVSGVYIRAGRDRFLDYSISRDLQSLGEHSVAYNALQQIDAVLGGSQGSNLQQSFSDFFKSFSDLSTKPEDMVSRQQVLTSANTLVTEFKRLYGSIQQVQFSEDRAVAYTVDDINAITAKIADLNAQIPVAQNTHSESEFTLRDNRQQLLEELSGLLDISYYETDSGSITVTTTKGGALVVGNQSNNLELNHTSTGTFLGVQLEGNDPLQLRRVLQFCRYHPIQGDPDIFTLAVNLDIVPIRRLHNLFGFPLPAFHRLTKIGPLSRVHPRLVGCAMNSTRVTSTPARLR